MEMPLLPSLPPPSFCLSQVRQVVALYTRILLHFAQKFRPPGPTLYRHGVAQPAAPSPLLSSPSLPIHYTTLYTKYDTIQDTIWRFSSILLPPNSIFPLELGYPLCFVEHICTPSQGPYLYIENLECERSMYMHESLEMFDAVQLYYINFRLKNYRL